MLFPVIKQIYSTFNHLLSGFSIFNICQAIQDKQVSLLEQCDSLDQENDELREQVADLEQEKESLECLLEKAQDGQKEAELRLKAEQVSRYCRLCRWKELHNFS